MSPSSLSVLAEEQLALAGATGSGRSARTVHGGSGSLLRQTLVALVAGHARHSLHADEDSVVLLTVVRG